MQHPGTYQTRISAYAGVSRSDGDGALSAYGELYGRVQRRLFADVATGRSAASLKREYLKRYGIPARMFNGVRVSLEGKVASVREQQKLRVDNLGRRIARAERQIADAAERGRWDQVHQKKRRLAKLRHPPGWVEGLTLIKVGPSAAVLRVEAAVAEAVQCLGQNGYASHRGMAQGLAGSPQR